MNKRAHYILGYTRAMQELIKLAMPSKEVLEGAANLDRRGGILSSNIMYNPWAGSVKQPNSPIQYMAAPKSLTDPKVQKEDAERLAKIKDYETGAQKQLDSAKWYNWGTWTAGKLNEALAWWHRKRYDNWRNQQAEAAAREMARDGRGMTYEELMAARDKDPTLWDTPHIKMPSTYDYNQLYDIALAQIPALQQQYARQRVYA